MCRILDIQCINIPNNHHQDKNNRLHQEASYRTAESMNFILEYQKQNPDYYLLLDSDMFLIDYLDIEEYNKYDCSIVLQKRKNIDKSDIYYIWNGLYYFNINKLETHLMNWHCTFTTDTGGMMTNWLQTKMKNFPDVNELKTNMNKKIVKENCRFITYLPKLEWNINNMPDNIKNNNTNTKLIDFLIHDPRNKDGYFFCELYDNKFLHYRAGGNWEKKDIKEHVELSIKLKNALL
jgi:hypothetical protein